MKDKIVGLIWMYPDKIGHLMGGYIIAQILACIPYINIYAIVPAIFIIALFNELVDQAIKDSFSWRDILVTVLGGVLGLIQTIIYSTVYNINIDNIWN